MSVPPNVPGAPEGPQGQQPPYAPQAGGPQGYAPPPGYAPQPGYGVPPQPPKKKGKGKFIVLGIVALVMIAIIGSALGGGDEKAGEPASSSTSKTDDASGEDGKAKGADEAPSLPKLGDAVVAGDLEFTLTDFECGVTVKDKIDDEVKPQGKFCKVHVSVKNIGKSEKYLSGDDVKLFTEDDIEYSNSSDVWFVEDVLSFDSINPGITLTGDVYFDIPEDVDPSFAGVGGGLFGKPTMVSLS